MEEDILSAVSAMEPRSGLPSPKTSFLAKHRMGTRHPVCRKRRPSVMTLHPYL